jgi:ribosomal protein S8
MEKIILHTDDNAYARITTYLEKTVCPVITSLISVYNPLDIGPFTTEAYTDVVKNKGIDTKERFRQLVESEISSAKLPRSLLKMMDSETFISDTLKDFEEACKKVIVIFNQYRDSVSSVGVINYSDILIKKGLPVVDTKTILERCQIVLDTEQKVLFHQQMLKVVHEFEELKKVSTSINMDYFPGFSNLFDITVEDSVVINPYGFDVFFSSNKAAEFRMPHAPLPQLAKLPTLKS